MVAIGTPIFNWGDNVADTNTNVTFHTLLPQLFLHSLTENPTNAEIHSLIYITGIPAVSQINIDIPGIPAGTYSYIRFYAPRQMVDDNQAEIRRDADFALINLI